MKKLFLVDVSSMYFRAYYAVRPLSNSEGMPTNALYGFLSMTVKLLKSAKPDYLAFCFDNKTPSFRKDLYPEYKANRSEMPEDLVPQVPYVRKLTDLLGIKAMQVEGYEADDLIGSLVTYGRDNDLEVVIVSGDKDFGQMVQPYVSMYDTMKEVRYDEQGVQDKWGIPPTQVIDYLALVGDSSDNIPGVRGIGPKGAQKLLAEYPTLEKIYDSIDEISNKNMKKKLEDCREMAFLSKKLVTIVSDLDLVSELNELKMQEIDRDALLETLEELDFKSFEKSLLGGGSAPKEKKGKSSKSDKNEKGESANSAEVRVSSSAVSADGIKATEVEIQKLDKVISPNQEVWGLSSDRGIYLGVGKELFVLKGEPKNIGEILSGKDLQWCGNNLKAFWKEIVAHDPRIAWDHTLAAYVLRAGAIEGFEELFSKYVGGALPELPTPEQLFACHLSLRENLEKQLKNKNGWQVYTEMDLPLAPVLYEMERKGILLDQKELDSQRTLLGGDIETLEKLIQEEAGEKFNVASTKQLADILFNKMGIPPVKKTKTGFSTDNDVLEKLSPDHKIAGLVIEFREFSKLKSTYVDALPLLVNPDTGRLHTHLNQAHTATGRLSSHDPNLQNIPIRTERGSRVRRAFIPDKGNQLLSIDYSQIELRILAHITEDQGLCEAFEAGTDIHAATASGIYGIEVEDVTSDQRRNAKAVNFGIAYGQGPFGLAENLGISRKEAADIIGQYFNRFPKVHDYMMNVVEEGKKKGFVETVFGRRRYLDELNSKNGRIRKFGERAAINAPVQGTASDLVKKAMIDVNRAQIPGMILQVHDELLFEVPKKEVKSVESEVCKIMEDVADLKVPLSVNSATGKNWEEAHA